MGIWPIPYAPVGGVGGTGSDLQDHVGQGFQTGAVGMGSRSAKAQSAVPAVADSGWARHAGDRRNRSGHTG